MRFIKLTTITALLLLAACAKDISATTVKDNATAGKVLEGKIISAHAVKVKAADKLQDNGIGKLGGGAAGLGVGSNIGKGNGQLGAQIAGALIGAVAGAAIQDALGTSDGIEYLVKIDRQYIDEARKISKRVSVKGAVQDDLSSSAEVATKTDIIAVVQEPDASLQVGTRVYVIYHDDRPRVVAQ